MNEARLDTPALDALLKRLSETGDEGWQDALSELVMLKKQYRHDQDLADQRCAKAHGQYSKLWAKAYRFAEEVGLPLRGDND